MTENERHIVQVSINATDEEEARILNELTPDQRCDGIIAWIDDIELFAEFRRESEGQ